MDKREFAQQKWRDHRRLYKYSGLLHKTISSIKIEKEGVYFETRFGTSFLVNEADPRNNPVEALNFGSLEGWDEFACHVLASESQSFIDVGANIGWFSCNLATAHSSLEHVLAIEPLPAAHRFLEKNIDLNNLGERVQLVRAACGSVSGSKEILWDETELGASSFFNIFDRPNPKRVAVPVVTLDSLLAETKSEGTCLLKIDVEGSELECLLGAEGILATKRPLIYMELVRKWAKKAGHEINAIIQLLTKNGYQGYRTYKGSLVNFHEMTNTIPNTNFIFFPTEKSSLAGKVKKKMASEKYRAKYSFLTEGH